MDSKNNPHFHTFSDMKLKTNTDNNPLQNSFKNNKSRNSNNSKAFSCGNSIQSFSSILVFKPETKLTISNFAFNKIYTEKIFIKNLMNFPLVMKVRSSDSKKLEINSTNITSCGSNKILKLSANQKANIELLIQIENNQNEIFFNKNSYNDQKNVISLFINFSCELCDVKYPIELNSCESSVKMKKSSLENLLSNEHSNDVKRNNEELDHVDIQFTNENIEDKEKKINHPIFTRKCSSTSPFESIEYSNVYLNSNEGNFQSEMKIKETKFLLEKKLSYFTQFSNLEIHNEQKFSLYSNIIKNCKKCVNSSNLNLFEENKILKEKLDNLMKKFEDLESLLQSYSKTISEFKILHKCSSNNYNLKNNFKIDTNNKINLEIKSENLNSIILKNDKLNILKINYEKIDDNIINSIKERFIELELNNFRENQLRVESVLKFIENVENLFFFSEKLLNFSDNDNEPTSKENNINNPSEFYDNVNKNGNLFYQQYQFEKIIKSFQSTSNNLLQVLSPIALLNPVNSNLLNIENEILKKISIVTQGPLLPKEEVEVLYNQIQNLNLISNELDKYKIENKKLEIENTMLNREINQFNKEMDNYRKLIKTLEEDLDLFKNELTQKEQITNTKEVLIDKLNEELEMIKNHYENIIKEYEDKIEELKQNDELFQLLSEKDNFILELQSQLMIKENVIDNLKKIKLKEF